MYIEEASTPEGDYTDAHHSDIDPVDPRKMGEYFTRESADSLLSQAIRTFGITFDDMSEVSIYKVYTAPSGETEDGFLDI